ncbi:MAG: hypothetical protein ACI9C4_001952 [Paraglaciecola sp.]|jgi:hypothetical protein
MFPNSALPTRMATIYEKNSILKGWFVFNGALYQQLNNNLGTK